MTKKRAGFVISTRGSIIQDGKKKKVLNEPLLDSDSFATLLNQGINRQKRNTVLVKNTEDKDSLDRDHEDFDNSINNKEYNKILEYSMKTMLKHKFAYQMTLESQIINIENVDVKEYISGHIIICGYNKGWNQLIESIREESDVPVCIISDTSKIAKISNISWMFANILYFKGDPLNFEHLRNSNIENCLHVVIPSNTVDEYGVADTCAVLKANIIKQNWPEVKISVEFTSNYMIPLIENLLNTDTSKDSYRENSVYQSKGYLNGKVFSSVLFSRMCVMKTLEKQWYQTINRLLEHQLSDSNIITLKIPKEMNNGEELTYGNVKDFILLNNKLKGSFLLCIGAYVKDKSTLLLKDSGLINEDKLNTAINRSDSLNTSENSDENEEFSHILVDFAETYDQYISELHNS